MQNPLQNLPPMAAALAAINVLLRSAANGCGRLRTVADAETTGREQGSIPPELNDPFATHSGKAARKHQEPHHEGGKE